MFKKIMSAVLTIGMICSCSSIVLGDNNPLNLTVSAKEKGVTDYTYAVTPVLSPFNEYFYVKTDNPDPFSFRFVDNSTVYGEKGIFVTSKVMGLFSYRSHIGNSWYCSRIVMSAFGL